MLRLRARTTEIHRDAIGSMTGSEFEKMMVVMMIEKRKIDDEFEERLDDLKKRMAVLEGKIRSDN